MHFFTTTNLLAAEQEAGIKHHVALSVVGAQVMPDSGYNTAKEAVAAVDAASTRGPIMNITGSSGCAVAFLSISRRCNAAAPTVAET